jgi:hypothetical protein
VGVIREQVDLAVGRHVDRGVDHALIGFGRRRSPQLRRQGIVRQLRGERREGVREIGGGGTRHAAAGLAVIVIFGGDIDEPDRTDPEPDIPRDLDTLAIAALVILPVARDHLEPAFLLEPVIEHPGDRVRAILRRRPLAQDLQAADRQRRDGGKIRPLRAARQCRVAAGRDLHQRRAIVAFAVDHHEDFVGGQAPQRRRADESGCIGDRILPDIERRNDILQAVEHVRGGLRGELRRTDDVDRRRRIDERTIGPPRAENDDVPGRASPLSIWETTSACAPLPEAGDGWTCGVPPRSAPSAAKAGPAARPAINASIEMEFMKFTDNPPGLKS